MQIQISSMDVAELSLRNSQHSGNVLEMLLTMYQKGYCKLGKATLWTLSNVI